MDSGGAVRANGLQRIGGGSGDCVATVAVPGLALIDGAVAAQPGLARGTAVCSIENGRAHVAAVGDPGDVGPGHRASAVVGPGLLGPVRPGFDDQLTRCVIVLVVGRIGDAENGSD